MRALSDAALEGVRVLSFGAFAAGNTTAALLAELGAEVAKIEGRSRPEVLRMPAYAIGPVMATEPSGVTNTIMEAALARGTFGLSLDMASDAGRQLLWRLVAVADVVVENFGAGVMERWGCSFDELLERNPRLVMTSLSGYGRSGPRSSYLAYASNISNFVGLTHTWGYCHGTHSDYLTAAHAAMATVAALHRARATGRGVHVEAAQVDVMAAVLAEPLLEAVANGHDPGAYANEMPGALLSGVFPCLGHDAWLALELEDLDDWHALCQVLERPDLDTGDAAAAEAARAELRDAVAAWAAARTHHTAAHLLQQAGLAAGPVQSIEDVWRDPQHRSRGYVVELDQPDLGRRPYPRAPIRLSATPARARRAGPRLGEHTDQLLRTWLDLDDDELAELHRCGAVFQAR